MQSILIADPSELIRGELEKELKKKYRVLCCGNGVDGLELLRSQRPEGLVLNLSLPGMDGLFLLEAAEEFRPRAIVTLSTAYPPYVARRLKDLGVGCMLLIPTTLYAISRRIDDMLGNAVPAASGQDALVFHLHRLGLPCWSGYQMLRVGIPLYAQDRTQSMTKELYPAIAASYGCGSWQQVESAIRDVIRAGWECGEEEIWTEYFSGPPHRPTNKEFISRLSEFLDG